MRWKLLLAGLVSFGTILFLLWPGMDTKAGQEEEPQKEPSRYAAPERSEASEETEASAESSREGFSCHKLDKEIQRRISGKSYKPNDYVTFDDLRHIKIRYYGFDGRVKDGELIVNRRIADDVLEIFYDLYCSRYPLQEVSLVDKYDADDERSMAANNTSCFNYREIAGTDKLSNHAYGLAIDINPLINPCIRQGSGTAAEEQSVYAQRDMTKCRGAYKAYMIQKGDYIYRLFQKHGFSWGGDWSSVKDYQHFEKPQMTK